MNTYLTLKEKHQKEINDFPMIFAFNNTQLNEGLEKLKVTKEELYSIGGGGFIRKSDSGKLHKLYIRQDKEVNSAIEEDKTGLGYIKEMFQYELANHEYSYTMDAEDTLNALGLTAEKVVNTPLLLKGFKAAGGTYL